MPIVDFARYPYVPAMQSSPAEHMGFRQLPPDARERILPLFELSQRSNGGDLDPALGELEPSSGGRPFLLDLSKEPAPPPYVSQNPVDRAADDARAARERAAQASYNALVSRLLSPADGFAEWRSLVARFPSAVPCLQFTDAATQSRAVLRQAALLSRETGSLAIRFGHENALAIRALVPQIISVLESADRLLLIADCGQGRQHLSRRATFAADTMTGILADLDLPERPLLRAVCMSSSFTRPSHDGLVQRESFDWRLWREAREAFPFAFGDYAATPRTQRQTTYTPADWRAMPSVPLDESWLIYRHENIRDPSGWSVGARLLIADPAAGELPASWGAEMLQRAAAGNVDGVDSSRFWNAARVNMHLLRQVALAERNVNDAQD